MILNFFVLPILLFIKFGRINSRGKSVIKQFLIFLLVEYFICLAAITIIPLPSTKGTSGYLNLDFYHQTYNNLLSAINHTSERKVWNELENILGNIILFFPFGFLLPIVFKKCLNFFITLFLAFVTSFFIEAVQYYWSIEWHYGRVSDVDDIALNAIGSIVGFLLFCIFKNTLIKVRIYT